MDNVQQPWEISTEELAALLEHRERQRLADWERSEQLGHELLITTQPVESFT